MPNIRFTRGGKWMYQQCKTYRRGSSDTMQISSNSATNDLTKFTYKQKYGIDLTDEEIKELYKTEEENSKGKNTASILVIANLVLNIVLFIVGVFFSLILVFYAVISTVIGFVIMYVYCIHSNKVINEALVECVKKIKAVRDEREKEFNKFKAEKLPDLIISYEDAVFNYIDMLKKEYNNYSYFSLKEKNFWFPLKEFGDDFGAAKELITIDGFKLMQNNTLVIARTKIPYYANAYEKTKFLVNTLKEEIVENGQCGQDGYLTAVIYLVVRNNFIKYFHDKFAKEFPQIKTVSELYEYNTKHYINTDEFTYYYIYETDINLPIEKTYLDIIDKLVSESTAQLKDQLLKSREAETPATQTETQNDEVISEQTEIPVEKMQVDEKKEISPIEVIDKMTGRQFEKYIAQLFEKRGYKATVTPVSGDYGIDVIIEDGLGVKIGIQAKCYSDKVPNSAVQEAVTGIKHYGCVKAMVITNNYFQPSAIQLAKENNVTLWDRNKLKYEVEK